MRANSSCVCVCVCVCVAHVCTGVSILIAQSMIARVEVGQSRTRQRLDNFQQFYVRSQIPSGAKNGNATVIMYIHTYTIIIYTNNNRLGECAKQWVE